MAHKLPLADIQFIADFAAFCRSKGDEGYDYVDPTNCAASQFLRETGRAADPSCSPAGWGERNKGGERNPRTPFPAGVDVMGGGVLGVRPQTFSALADRLEALIADAPVVERAQ